MTSSSPLMTRSNTAGRAGPASPAAAVTPLPVITPPTSRGRSNSRYSAIAPPTTSARSVAIATNSACSQYAMRVGVRVWSATASGSVRPVTSPSLADRYCTRPAITLASTITQTSRKPYCAPALTFAATLPGST